MAISTKEMKILRIGIIQNGKIIEERLIRKRENVTIGQGPKNAFVIPATTLPKSHVIFEMRAERYYLVFTQQMDGRVLVDDQVVDFKSLRNQKIAKKRGDLFIVPIDDRSRGRVVFDDVTLLFQFVAPPPVRTKAQLPADMRSGIVKTMDWVFATILSVSMVLHTGTVVFMQVHDWPIKTGWDQIPDRFAKLIIPEIPEEAPKQDDGDDGTNVEEGQEEEKEERKSKGKRAEGEQAATLRRARLQKAVAGKGLLKILGARGEGGGIIADVLKGGGIEGDMDQAFKGVSGVGMATSGSGVGKGRRSGDEEGGGSGSIQSIGVDDLGTSGGGKVAGTFTKKVERKVSGIVKTSKFEVDGNLDSGAIASVVRRRLGMVKNCYERELKRNPKLAGKIVIRFTIGSMGRVTTAVVESNSMGDAAVANCIKGRIVGWRFPKPEGGSVTVAYPFVFTAS